MVYRIQLKTTLSAVHRELMTTEKSITELVEGDICQYFPLQPESLPEAFPGHNKSAATAMLPKTGCKGLQVPSHAEHHVFTLQQLAIWGFNPSELC